MCAYCNMGDHAFRHNPPWDYWREAGEPLPSVPRPVHPGPVVPWSLERMKEYRDLLKEIRDLEEKIGCPCEPNKADYIALFDERISQLEKRKREIAPLKK